MKAAVVILSDPNHSNEEATGRVVNALAAAYDFKQKGDEVTILFQGTGTRWASRLANPEHPLHQLYKAVEDKVAGVSCGCAEVFGADTSGFDLIKDNAVPGTPGLPSMRNLIGQGYSILSF